VIFLLPCICWGQKKEVSIRISQNESFLLQQYETHLVLRKTAFKIQVLLGNTSGVYVFAAFTDSICCRISEVDTIEGLGNLPERTMKEGYYNKEKELLVNDDNSCSYWYYDSDMAEHRFNKKIIFLDSGRVVGTKTVKQLLYVPTGREIKLKEINQPLYLLFVAVAEFDSNGKPLKELIRKKVKIDWINDD
jgi:hypothetical protein